MTLKACLTQNICEMNSQCHCFTYFQTQIQMHVMFRRQGYKAIIYNSFIASSCLYRTCLISNFFQTESREAVDLEKMTIVAVLGSLLGFALIIIVLLIIIITVQKSSRR